MRIILKQGKERALLQKHHWIYSGAIKSVTSKESGELVEVFTSSGDKLGLAFLNPGHSIAAHMIAFGQESLEEALINRLIKAAHLRKKWFDPNRTDALRLINAEGDGIPGLIIDSYANTLVMQVSHPGIERIKELLLKLIIREFSPKSIIEKSTSFLRKKGGMKEARSFLYGEEIGEVTTLENGLKYSVDLIEGQKTGFFIDQREMRKLVRELSERKKVLNCFAYTGGFSISALAGGAIHVDSVEISQKCEERVSKNIALNHLPGEKHQFINADVFDFLKNCTWDYDLVILDPPAFVKKREDVSTAFRAYKNMNAKVMKEMKPNSLLLSCSCSYHIEEALFQNILFRASLEAGRSIRILSSHRMAMDHPISIFHPESSYLKSFLLVID